MKTVVFVETNFSGLDALLYCREQGYRTILITDSLERFASWFPKSVLYKLDAVSATIKVANSNDFDEVMAVLQNQVGSLDAILTFAEIRTQVVARLAQALGLKGAAPEAIAIAQDKHRFRACLAAAGVENLYHRLVASIDELAAIKDELVYPCFIKPSSGHSSLGAVACHSAAEVAGIVARLRDLKSEGISSAFVIEEYLDGPLVSVEALTTGKGRHQILGIADRDVVRSSIEVGSSFPRSPAEAQAVTELAQAALDAIGYDFGASHTEMILTAKGPRLVEINTRVGGSGHSVMLDAALGRSVTGDCVELCLGQLAEVPVLYQAQRGAAWQCYACERPGVIRILPEVNDLLGMPGVIAVWYHHEVGDRLGELDSNFNWVLQVMCVGSDADEAKERAQIAIKRAADRTLIDGSKR